MTDSTSTKGSTRLEAVPIPEIDVLWLTAGLGCDGDTIAMTAATQPSIEDLVRGAYPWIPKVHLKLR
jgi:hydrogenase small subunit